MSLRIFCVACLISCSLFGVEGEPDGETGKLSEAFGHLIRKNIETLGMSFDIDHVIKGIQDAYAGKESPMSELECIQTLGAKQQAIFLKKSTENLEKAEHFLETNKSQKNIVLLEEGKIQYRIEAKGKGERVEADSSPLIHYVGRHIDGSIFGQSEEPQVISLTDTIPGFKQGLLGMLEGEKRTLYIHPEYGYGMGGMLPPNSLLTFDVEVVKADTKKENKDEALILESGQMPAHSASVPPAAAR